MSEIQYEAYCFKCKIKKIVKNPEIVKTKNGRDAIKGICPICNTTMFKFLPKTKVE